MFAPLRGETPPLHGRIVDETSRLISYERTCVVCFFVTRPVYKAYDGCAGCIAATVWLWLLNRASGEADHGE